MKTKLTCLIGWTALLLCVPIAAQNKPAKPPETPSPAKPSTPAERAVPPRGAQPDSVNREAKPSTPARTPIRPEERKVIQAYIDDYKGAEKGPGRSGALPPGLAQKAARGEELPPAFQSDGLPPGLWKRVQDENPPPLTFSSQLGGFELKDGHLIVNLKKNFTSAVEACAAVDPFLRAWEVETDIKLNVGMIRFTFERAEVVDSDAWSQAPHSRTLAG